MLSTYSMNPGTSTSESSYNLKLAGSMHSYSTHQLWHEPWPQGVRASVLACSLHSSASPNTNALESIAHCHWTGSVNWGSHASSREMDSGDSAGVTAQAAGVRTVKLKISFYNACPKFFLHWQITWDWWMTCWGKSACACPQLQRTLPSSEEMPLNC